MKISISYSRERASNYEKHFHRYENKYSRNSTTKSLLYIYNRV